MPWESVWFPIVFIGGGTALLAELVISRWVIDREPSRTDLDRPPNLSRADLGERRVRDRVAACSLLAFGLLSLAYQIASGWLQS